MTPYKIFAQFDPAAQCYGIHVFSYSGLNYREQQIAQPATFVPYESGGGYIPPMLALPQDGAQQLMDQLWNCGIRPSEGSGSAGSLAATERHLADMRKIAFKQLGI